MHHVCSTGRAKSPSDIHRHRIVYSLSPIASLHGGIDLQCRRHNVNWKVGDSDEPNGSVGPCVTSMERGPLGFSMDPLRGGLGELGRLGIEGTRRRLGAGDTGRKLGELTGRILGEGGAMMPMLLSRFGFCRKRGNDSRDNVS